MQLKLSSAALLAGAQALVAPGATKPALSAPRAGARRRSRARRGRPRKPTWSRLSPRSPRSRRSRCSSAVGASTRRRRAPGTSRSTCRPASARRSTTSTPPASARRSRSSAPYAPVRLKHGRVAMLAAFGFPIADTSTRLRRQHRRRPVWKSNSASGALSHFSVMTRPPDSVERRGTGIATPSSRRRVDGVEDDAMIQHERAVKF